MNKRFAILPLGLSSVFVASQAQAEVPAEVLTAITTAGTDAAVIGAAVLVVLIGIWAFKLLRRAK
jgi:hypothetical protein